MKSFLLKFKNWIFTHKKISIVLLIGLIVGGYFIFRGSNDGLTTYVLANVEKGTLISSISGSGQVEASNQIDLKARSSGEITYVAVKPGQEVRKGQTLFALDARDAQKSVRDAETALQTAELDLEKFKQPPKTLDVQALEAEIATSEKSITDAEKVIQTAYRDLLNSSTVASPNDTLTVNDTAPTITGTYQKDIEGKILISVYQSGAGLRFSLSGTPSNIVGGGGEVSTTVSQPLGDTGLYIKFGSTSGSQPQWNISLPNKSAADYVSNLKKYQDALDSKEEIIKDANLSIAQNKQKIADLYTPESFELRSKELVVKQKQDALKDAKANLSDYYVSAPFAGLISSVIAKVGDTASGTLGTIITKQKIATVSLNEVDIAKIKLGQKATLTFDATEELSITGEVVEIDATGTVSAGVVNYNVKIAFDTDSDEVKPGMSVSASIITDMKQGALLVPISAVKTDASGSYVETITVLPGISSDSTGGIPSEFPPEQIRVEVGISNDDSIEIISGLLEGDQIVTRTISSTSTTTSKQAPSLFGSPSAGGRSGGGGFAPR